LMRIVALRDKHLEALQLLQLLQLQADTGC
jgi:hypothetical protein